MVTKIPRCYDSHVHLLATGEYLNGLNLKDLTSPKELANTPLRSEFYRGSWLVGFGWDQNNFENKSLPTRQDLDRIFPNTPVVLSRIDGHASWLNTIALKESGYWDGSKVCPPGGKIARDEQGLPTGMIYENAKIELDLSLPSYSVDQSLGFLKTAAAYFNKNGFTHVRDMTGNLRQWQLLRQLVESKELKLFVEQNFVAENLADLDRAIGEAQEAKRLPSSQLRVGAIKIFIDGSLGSETAFLSQPYSQAGDQGQLLWADKEILLAIRKIWQADLPVAIHSIGDQAAEQVAQCLEQLKQEGLQGICHLEHAEVLRTETIKKLKSYRVICHMQPCQLLSDQKWLSKKLGELFRFAFPWEEIRQIGIEHYWGSDSPIEAPSISNNLKALKECQNIGIKSYGGDLLLPHSHPDPTWGAGCETEIADNGLLRITFKNNSISF